MPGEPLDFPEPRPTYSPYLLLRHTSKLLQADSPAFRPAVEAARLVDCGQCAALAGDECVYILRHLGTLGVLTSAEGISAIGGGLYGLVRVGRWWRDVRPPEPKARRVGQEDASP